MQNFCLKWDSFYSSLAAVFEDLRLRDELVDITLCSSNGSYRAHKVILSACSPYLRQVIQKIGNDNQHVVFFIQSDDSSSLGTLIEFMYQGTVNVSEQQLPGFLRLAEQLQIKGLSGGSGGGSRGGTGAGGLPTVSEKEAHELPNNSPTGHAPTYNSVRSISSQHEMKSDSPSPISPLVTNHSVVTCASLPPTSYSGAHTTSATQRSANLPDGVCMSFKAEPECCQSSNAFSNSDVNASKQPEFFVGENIFEMSLETTNTSFLCPTSPNNTKDDGDCDRMSENVQPTTESSLSTPTGYSSQVASTNYPPFNEIIVSDESGNMYECGVCGKRYHKKTSLNMHQQSHIGRTKCPLCGHVSSMIHHLRSHLIRYHKLSLDEVRSLVPTRQRYTYSDVSYVPGS